MRAAFWMLPLALSGAGCSPTTDVSDESSPPAASGSAPAGFENWLFDQCPDGAVVDARDAATGELVRTATCKSLREGVLADASVRDRLIEVYMIQTAEPVDPIGGERIGEAKEPWSPLGLLCDFIFATMVGYGCHRSNLDWRACLGVSTAPMIACNLL